MNDNMDDGVTDGEKLVALVAGLEASDADAEAVTGSCVYVAAGKAHCAELTKVQCTAISGTWNSSTHCKKKPGQGECAAQ